MDYVKIFEYSLWSRMDESTASIDTAFLHLSISTLTEMLKPDQRRNGRSWAVGRRRQPGCRLLGLFGGNGR